MDEMGGGEGGIRSRESRSFGAQSQFQGPWAGHHFAVWLAREHDLRRLVVRLIDGGCEARLGITGGCSRGPTTILWVDVGQGLRLRLLRLGGRKVLGPLRTRQVRDHLGHVIDAAAMQGGVQPIFLHIGGHPEPPQQPQRAEHEPG